MTPTELAIRSAIAPAGQPCRRRAQIAALPQGSVVLAEDETHLDLLARVRSRWMPSGQRHRILTPGTNLRRILHGAVNLATGAFHHHVSVKNVSAVICDNGSTHHARSSSAGSPSTPNPSHRRR
jgi:hypothetical protein